MRQTCDPPLMTPASLPTVFMTSFFKSPADQPDLHSFPTRRSSDLAAGFSNAITARVTPVNDPNFDLDDARNSTIRWLPSTIENAYGPRSEEHTSELQSHHDLVCRLLLEKKKKRPGVHATCGRRATHLS